MPGPGFTPVVGGMPTTGGSPGLGVGTGGWGGQPTQPIVPGGPGSHAWAGTHPNYGGPGFTQGGGFNPAGQPPMQIGAPQAAQGQTPMGQNMNPALMSALQRLFLG
jgi:hypothetical protein